MQRYCNHIVNPNANALHCKVLGALLRKAEKYAIRKGSIYLSCYRRLLAIYKRIKGRKFANCAECLDLEMAVLEIASAYGNAEQKKEHDSCKFMVTLEGAAPYLFTFLRYQGMPPHNNAVELEIRNAVVLHRNVCCYLSEPEGMEVSRC